MNIPPSAVPMPSTPSSALPSSTVGQIRERLLHHQETKQKKHFITDMTIGPSAGPGLSTGTCDHHHYRPPVPGGSSFQLLVYSRFPAARRAATCFSGSLRLLHLSPGYTSPLPISHCSRHYSNLPIYFFLLTIKFQHAQSHTSTQAHCATLKAGQFVTGGQKDTGKLSI